MGWNAPEFSFNSVCVWDDRELTKPPAAHVVQLSTEEHGGQDVDHRKDNPENSIPFSKHLANIKTHLKTVPIRSSNQRCLQNHFFTHLLVILFL